MKLLKARVLLSTILRKKQEFSYLIYETTKWKNLTCPQRPSFLVEASNSPCDSFLHFFFEHHLSKSIVGLRPLGRIEILSQVVPFVLTSVFNRATNRLARPEWQEWAPPPPAARKRRSEVRRGSHDIYYGIYQTNWNYHRKIISKAACKREGKKQGFKPHTKRKILNK